MDDKDNANPTVLTASELPTRQIKKKKTPASDADAKFADAVSRRPLFLSDPFCDVSWSDDTESDDEFIEEPIDEQEIYGQFISHASYSLLFVSSPCRRVLRHDALPHRS